jgi:uncharacterized Zn-binding protein involved in type VI secretion
MIGNMKAWRAMPAGVGAGLEEASKETKAIMDVVPDPVNAFILMKVQPKEAKIKMAMEKVAGQVESATKTPGASAAVKTAFLTLKATGTALDVAYQSASKAPAPGAEPAARIAFTIGYQKALAAAMSASVASMAGPWDMHACAAPGPNPHGPGFVMKGCTTVFINKLPAVMHGQEVMEAAGGPNSINVGCDTVFIGDTPPAAASSADGKASKKDKKSGGARKGSAAGKGTGAQPDPEAGVEEKIIELHVRDPETGLDAANRSFRLMSSTTVHSGTLDANGKAKVTVTTGESDWELELDLG